MALLQVNFTSAILHRKVMMQVILPSDAGDEVAGPFKTLYLLHGLMDNCLAWTSEEGRGMHDWDFWDTYIQ